MILYVKKEEVDSVINKLSDIEESFWLHYKSYSKQNREYLENAFDTIYKKLDAMQEANQIEMEI